MTTCANRWSASQRARSPEAQRRKPCIAALLLSALLASAAALAQDGGASSELDAVEFVRPATCFGIVGISHPRALAICDALALEEHVRARELGEQWLREQPDSPAAQFAYAEVLYEAEGNLARALFHLDQAESLTSYQSLEEAAESGNLQWHYLTLSQLSSVHQIMGNQLRALEYLDRINSIYGQEIESFRGWPLLKLKRYDEARASARSVLENSDSEFARARAWNTLCAVELASLAPVDSMEFCQRAIDEDERLAAVSTDTIALTNAAEVALSLLQIDEAESYLARATRNLNPGSVANPWIPLLYLTMGQARFGEAHSALERMLVWREYQQPIISVMNRAEHHIVSASFLLLAGYAEDSAALAATALNQPDRNGSYSADDFQKDALAAFVHAIAQRLQYQLDLEHAASDGWTGLLRARVESAGLRFSTWRSERFAASLFTRPEILLNRLRPYAPLDVHVPEWIEPELVRMIGPGVVRQALEQAREAGAFQLNTGYYHAWHAEAAAVAGQPERVLEHGKRALALLPVHEALLRARIAARMGDSSWRLGRHEAALDEFALALRDDPGILRRLGASLPVSLRAADGKLARQLAKILRASPRFREHANGLPLEIGNDGAICLRTRSGEALSCYTAPAAEVAEASRAFHFHAFGPGIELSKAQRSILRGSSVILSNGARPMENGPELLAED